MNLPLDTTVTGDATLFLPGAALPLGTGTAALRKATALAARSLLGAKRASHRIRASELSRHSCLRTAVGEAP